MGELDGRRVAFVTAQRGIEEAELVEPWKAVTDAGATAVLLAPEAGEVQTVQHDEDKAGKYPVDKQIGHADASDYDAIVLPGGTVNADSLRLVKEAVGFVTEAISRRLVVAAICHGPWALVEADLVRGKTLTSYPSLTTDIKNAGGNWVDEEVQVDDSDGWTLITSRRPSDLKAFNAAIVEQLSAKI